MTNDNRVKIYWQADGKWIAIDADGYTRATAFTKKELLDKLAEKGLIEEKRT